MTLHSFKRLPVAMLLLASAASSQSPAAPPAHLTSSFDFTVAAPFDRVAPQFAPEAERGWGDPDWNPTFVYPQPGKDVEGAVFTVSHGHHNSVWVNTLFDVATGRMQYVYVIDGVMVCVIDVRVSSIDAGHTAVHVTYTRTALVTEHNEVVTHMSHADAQSGPDWKHHVEIGLGLSKP